MKTKTFFGLILSAMIFLALGLNSCKKNPLPGSYKEELPFGEYLYYLMLKNQPGGPELNVENVNGIEGALEIGYTFTPPVACMLDTLGAMMPDSGKTYSVSLWDSLTHELLVRRDIKITNTSFFNYVDLGTDSKVLQANHTYMVSINTGHISDVSPNPIGDSYYELIQKGGSIFPFTGYPHLINYNKEYTEHTGFSGPQYPTSLWPFDYVVTGFCDVGLTYFQPIPQK